MIFYNALDVVGSRRKRQRHNKVVNGNISHSTQVNDCIWWLFRILQGTVLPVHHRGASKGEPALLPVATP